MSLLGKKSGVLALAILALLAVSCSAVPAPKTPAKSVSDEALIKLLKKWGKLLSVCVPNGKKCNEPSGFNFDIIRNCCNKNAKCMPVSEDAKLYKCMMEEPVEETPVTLPEKTFPIPTSTVFPTPDRSAPSPKPMGTDDAEAKPKKAAAPMKTEAPSVTTITIKDLGLTYAIPTKDELENGIADKSRYKY